MRTRRMKQFALGLVVIGILSAIYLANRTPTASPEAAYSPGFFYLTSSAGMPATLIIADSFGPDSPQRKQIALNPPADCTLYALRPAPTGRWIAVEWECTFGPTVELFDTASGESHFALSNPSIDSRFLAWQPDGRSFYLKIGTLSVPQTLHVDAATSKAVELALSPFTYDLTASPDGLRVLYSLTKGIGFGSETWLAGPQGQNPSQLLVDPENITALVQYAPNGSQIAYIKFPDNQNTTPPGELWLMDQNGFRTQKLANADAGRGFPPVWSPDGSKIAFFGTNQPGEPASVNLSIYDVSQSKLTSVPFARQSAVPSTQPAWSPDGAFVAFSSFAPINSGGDTINIWFYEISSGLMSKLISGACCAGWIR